MVWFFVFVLLVEMLGRVVFCLENFMNFFVDFMFLVVLFLWCIYLVLLLLMLLINVL